MKYPFSREYAEQTINDLIVTVNHKADNAEAHIAFQGPVSEYISLPPRLRELATKLAGARDSGNIAEQNDLMAQAIQALDFNGDHVFKFSVHRNDASVLHNSGYDFKPENTPGKAKVNLLDLVPGVLLKHLEGVSGAYVIVLRRATTTAITELQWSETPDVEASWRGIGEGTFNKSRTEIRGVQPTKRIWVRARYHQDGGVGQWCPPVSIIIL